MLPRSTCITQQIMHLSCKRGGCRRCTDVSPQIMPLWQAAECLSNLQANLQADSVALNLQQSTSEMQRHLALPVSGRKRALVGRVDQEAERAEQCRADCS